jgi:hypothetical protein
VRAQYLESYFEGADDGWQDLLARLARGERIHGRRL